MKNCNMFLQFRNYIPKYFLFKSSLLLTTLSILFVIFDINRKYLNLSSNTRLNFSDSNNITGYSYFIVPNMVHLIRFESPRLTFVDMVNIKSIHINHKPEKLIIHCDDCNFKGKYWDMVKDFPEIELRYWKRPTHIFGKKISWIQHASDISRIEILMTYGGIYLDNDVFVVKPLHYFRRFEMAIGWDLNQYLGAQVIIAHKNARFLKLWHNSYKYYKPEKWYYNAGELPTKSILYKNPELVHRVVRDFGVDIKFVKMLYKEKSSEWKNFYTIHLLINHHYLVPSHRPVIFDEVNIIEYNKTYGDMVKSVYNV